MNKNISRSLSYLLILLIAILGIVLIRLIKLYDICCIIFDVASPVFFGFVIAWLLNPLYKRMNKKCNPKISFLILIILTIALYSLIIFLIIPIIVNESQNLLSVLDMFINKLKHTKYLSNIDDYFKIKPDFLLKYCNNIISLAVNFVLSHLFGFYILYNYNTIRTYVKKNIPLKYKDNVLKFTKKLSTNMYLYIKGTLIDTIVLFVITSILFSIFKLKYPLLLALLCAITNVIPFIGPYIGGIPAVLVGLSSSLNLGIISLIIVIASQAVESNIINPLIMSKCIKINPLLIIVAITVMGKFFGIIGMVFAVPVLIIIKLLYEFLKNAKIISNPLE